jgi:hypothetical protein
MTVAMPVSAVFVLGEEIRWRGYLLPASCIAAARRPHQGLRHPGVHDAVHLLHANSPERPGLGRVWGILSEIFPLRLHWRFHAVCL